MRTGKFTKGLLAAFCIVSLFISSNNVVFAEFKDNNIDEEEQEIAVFKESEKNDNILLQYTDKETIYIIQSYLTDEMGLNAAAASGIVANMTAESSLKTTALGDGGTSYGLCQWHNERFASLQDFADDHQKPIDDIEVQLMYFEEEMTLKYVNLLTALKNIPDTAKGAYEAGHLMCTEFEKPTDASSKADMRGRWAIDHYEKGIPEVAEDMNTLKILYMLNVHAGRIKVNFTVPVNGFDSQCTVDFSRYDNLVMSYDDSYWDSLLNGETASWIEPIPEAGEFIGEPAEWIVPEIPENTEIPETTADPNPTEVTEITENISENQIENPIEEIEHVQENTEPEMIQTES